MTVWEPASRSTPWVASSVNGATPRARWPATKRASPYTLTNLGLATLERDGLEHALALHKESLALYETLGDKTGMALVLVNLGDAAREQGNHKRAVALYDDALGLYREVGNERGVTRVLERLAAKR